MPPNMRSYRVMKAQRTISELIRMEQPEYERWKNISELAFNLKDCQGYLDVLCAFLKRPGNITADDSNTTGNEVATRISKNDSKPLMNAFNMKAKRSENNGIPKVLLAFQERPETDPGKEDVFKSMGSMAGGENDAQTSQSRKIKQENDMDISEFDRIIKFNVNDVTAQPLFNRRSRYSRPYMGLQQALISEMKHTLYSLIAIPLIRILDSLRLL